MHLEAIFVKSLYSSSRACPLKTLFDNTKKFSSYTRFRMTSEHIMMLSKGDKSKQLTYLS